MSTTNPEPGHAGADDHSPAGPPNDAVIKRGYEQDGYDTRSVVSVPLLVVGFFVAAFTTVTALFSYFRYPEPNASTHPGAAERNAVSLNEGMNRIHRGGEVDQPRLEPLVLRDTRGGDSRAITRPALPTGNSPELHPEDLRPSPEHTPALFESGWLPGKEFARITIDEAMTLASQPNYFKVDKAVSNPIASEHLPTAANAGRGAGPSTAVPPALIVEGKQP